MQADAQAMQMMEAQFAQAQNEQMMANEFAKMQIGNAPMQNHFAHIQQQPVDLNAIWDSAATTTAQPDVKTATAGPQTAGQSFQQPWMNPMMMGGGPMAGPIFQPPPQLV